MSNKVVGFIGLGRMGSGMASNLARAGISLTVFDARAEPMSTLVERGASAVADAADLASRVELLFLCLPSESEVEDVLFGERGVATTARDGLVIVDTTTMNYRAALALAERSENAGLSYSDCPISGMPFRAEAGTLTMMFGGSKAGFTDARPYLDVMGEFIVHCGEIGTGQLMKAVNNIIYNVNIAAICEVMPLAVKAGLGADKLAEVLTTASSRSFASEYFVPRILDRVFEGDFSMQAAYKDIVNVQQLAARLGASTPVVDAMVSTYDTAIAMGFGAQPKSAMVKVYEDRLGLEVRSPTSGRPGKAGDS
jgi:3-hydroxyisobutyrate dehydrogenase-like beta-hydroxyacid dehydrogenase